ncbi:MAG: lipoprotein signal peptidase [Gammaproteobacteria bacterium]|nr:lipoprotein signal peptidase [Gammaproteobacteria bacterium]
MNLQRQRGSFSISASRWLWLSAAVILVDQATKLWIVANFELFESRYVFEYFNLTRLHNTGAAFSFLAGASGWQRWFFIFLGIGVSIFIMAWLRTLPPKGQSWLSAGLALILGGALGNVIDRAVYGHVVDFLHFHYGDAYFPAFNAADSAITAGAICLIIDALLGQKTNQP